MKRNFSICIALVLLIISCKENHIPDGLRKLTESDQIEIAKKRITYNYDDVVFKNERGESIAIDSVNKILQNENYTADAYFNDKNEPEMVIIRPATAKDKDFRKRILKIYQTEIVDPVIPVKIDCQNIKDLLTKIYALDQDMRILDEGIDPEIDRENLITIISLIETCGMPSLKTVNREQMMAIWLVFQHTDNYHRKKYFPLLKKSSENGDLEKSQIALLEDRILMFDDKPQIYGSQITKNQESGEWVLYELKDPSGVDKRRAEVGLEPLQDYVSQWGIEFNIRQHK